jgi:hypothetical protein
LDGNENPLSRTVHLRKLSARSNLIVSTDRCNSTLAYPIDRQRLAKPLWLTWLRCPGCESIIARVLDDDAVYAPDLRSIEAPTR